MNGSKVFHSTTVAQIFKRFYTSVASNLVSKLPTPYGIYNTTSSIFRDFYSCKLGLRSCFVLSPVSRHFIVTQLASLDPKKAIGLDDLSSFFLRDAANSITLPINASILTKTVPESFKEAHVVPLFKKGSKLEPGNYRPVSILNVLSKIMEQAVHTQLNEYLERRDLLLLNQSGF